MTTSSTPAAPRGPGRRSLVRGAAWAAPIAMVGIAAPALAASAQCAPQTATTVQSAWSFTTPTPSINRWTASYQPVALSPGIRYHDDYHGLLHVALLTDNPPGTGEHISTLLSPVACLAPGTYRFTFDARLVHSNPRPIRLEADVMYSTTGTAVGNTVHLVTTSGVNPTSHTETVTITISQRTSVRFRYRWIFDGGYSGSLVADDIGVSAPRVAQTT